MQGSKLTLAPSPEASGNRGGWVEFLQRSSAGRVYFFIFSYFYLVIFRITIISWKEFVSFLRTKFEGYSLGDNSYEGAQSNINGDEVRV